MALGISGISVETFFFGASRLFLSDQTQSSEYFRTTVDDITSIRDTGPGEFQTPPLACSINLIHLISVCSFSSQGLYGVLTTEVTNNVYTSIVYNNPFLPSPLQS
jgi:hypothetical protein